MIRLFFAITLKEHQILTNFFNQCQQQLDLAGQIKWVKPEQLHITTAFIGEVDEHIAHSLVEQCKKIFIPLVSFKLKFAGNLVFYHHYKPAVVGIKFDVNNEILKLKEKTDNLLRKYGIDIDKRTYIPHVTFGRVKFAKNTDAFRKYEIEKHSNIEIFETEDYSLYQSILNANGAQYTPLWTSKFLSQ